MQSDLAKTHELPTRQVDPTGWLGLSSLWDLTQRDWPPCKVTLATRGYAAGIRVAEPELQVPMGTCEVGRSPQNLSRNLHVDAYQTKGAATWLVSTREAAKTNQEKNIPCAQLRKKVLGSYPSASFSLMEESEVGGMESSPCPLTTMARQEQEGVLNQMTTLMFC